MITNLITALSGVFALVLGCFIGKARANKKALKKKIKKAKNTNKRIINNVKKNKKLRSSIVNSSSASNLKRLQKLRGKLRRSK